MLNKYTLGIAMLLACSGIQAAEIQLRHSVVVDAPIVRLGDVADVSAPFPHDVKELQAIELFPAPIPEQHRYVRSRELIDILVRRGIDFSVHRISGSEVTRIGRAKELPVTGQAVQRAEPLRSADRKSAEHRLREAIIAFFQRQAADGLLAEQTAAIDADFQADDELVRAVLAAEEIQVSAGEVQGVAGQQTITIFAHDRSFSLEVTVKVPQGVVVAARPLPRGAVIREMDLRIDYDSSDRIAQVAYQTTDPVVGQQLTTAVSEGKPIARNSLRPPLVVHRGNVVTVIVRTGGVEVRTGGKALRDASTGEVVEVEALDDRDRTFFARAAGQLDPQTGLPIVEVFGGATTAYATP